jgi:phage-related protein
MSPIIRNAITEIYNQRQSVRLIAASDVNLYEKYASRIKRTEESLAEIRDFLTEHESHNL